MASFTSRLALKKNDGTDSFKRQDFLDNLDKIDAAPGTYICTSTTRPSNWGAAQAGRDIVETDTFRRLTWSGSGWVEPRVAIGSHIAAIAPNVYVNGNTTATYTLATITVLRPLWLVIMGNFRLATKPYLYTSAFCSILVDDIDRTRGAVGSMSWADQQTTATQLDDKPFPVYAEVKLSPGNHTLKGRVRVGNTSTNPVFVGAINTLSLVTQGSLGASVYLS